MHIQRAIGGGLASAVLVLAGCATKVEIDQGRWLATCAEVRVAECQEIAEVFVRNLALSAEALRRESGGVLVVAPIASCPALPDWAQADQCWRASAPTSTERACMIVARHKAPAPVLSFGQVGGDEFPSLPEPRKDGHEPPSPSAARLPTSAC